MPTDPDSVKTSSRIKIARDDSAARLVGILITKVQDQVTSASKPLRVPHHGPNSGVAFGWSTYSTIEIALTN